MPDPASASHSASVAEHISALIDERGGSISFAEFMQEALYAPGLGYYSAGARKLGAGGDFVTAPEVSPLFGYVLARQAAHLFAHIGAGDVFEPGAGSGALAAAVLKKLAALGILPDRYLILEVSAELRERQAAFLQREVPQLFERVHWVPQMPGGFRGMIIANEVADALPVERFRIKDGRVMQARVGVDAGRFCWSFAPAPSFLAEAVRSLESELGAPFANGFTSEISAGLNGWIGELAASVTQGIILLIDYGVMRREYYAPERDGGWLRCHFRHHVHDDPLVMPGIQDLTAWVDFTAIARAGIRSGMEVAGFVSQAHLLINGGVEDELAGFQDLPVQEQIRLSGQLKLLTLPGEMGEHFKCIGFCRGDCPTLPAFRDYDRAYQL